MGMQDPQQARAAQMQTATDGIDFDDPKSLRMLGERMRKMGRLDEAMALSQKAAAVEKAKVESDYKTAMTIKALREKTAEQYAKIDAKDYTPASLRIFSQTGDRADLVAATKEPKSDEPDKVRQYRFALTPEGGSFKGSFERFVSLAPSITAAAIAPLRAAQVSNIVDENAYNLPGKRISVTTPDGKVFGFKDQASANKFKSATGGR